MIVNISWLQDVLFGNIDIIFMENLPKKYKIFEYNEPKLLESTKNSSEKIQLMNRGTFKVDYALITDLMAPWRVPIKFDENELEAHEKKICDDQIKNSNKIKNNGELFEKDKVKLNSTLFDDKNNEKFIKKEDSLKNDIQEKKRILEENSESPIINGVIDIKYQNIDNDIGPPPLKRIKQEVDNDDNDYLMDTTSILNEKLSDENAVIRLLMNNIEEENSCLTDDSFLSTSHVINDSIVSSSGAISLINGNTNSENSNNSNNLEMGSNGSINKELDSQFKVPFDVRKLPSNDIVILLLGVHKKKDYEHYRSIIETLGGRIPLNMDDALKTTHLVISHDYHCMLPKLSIKFLCAFARAQFLVNIEWLNDSFKMEHFLSEINYQYENNEGDENLIELDNCNGEAKEQKMAKINQKSLVFQFYSLDLCKSWKCRSENLFKNFIFILTPSLIPMPIILKQVIQANGGLVVLKRLPNRRQLDALIMKNGQCSVPKIVIISCDNDLHLISDYLIKHHKVGMY